MLHKGMFNSRAAISFRRIGGSLAVGLNAPEKSSCASTFEIRHVRGDNM